MEKTLKPKRSELENWFLSEIAAQTERPVSEIDPEQPFAALGLDSTVIISLTGEMEDKWGLELDPTLVFEYPSISRLLSYLEAEGVVAA
jgi:acyl carrier protein